MLERQGNGSTRGSRGRFREMSRCRKPSQQFGQDWPSLEAGGRVCFEVSQNLDLVGRNLRSTGHVAHDQRFEAAFGYPSGFQDKMRTQVFQHFERVGVQHAKPKAHVWQGDLLPRQVAHGEVGLCVTFRNRTASFIWKVRRVALDC